MTELKDRDIPSVVNEFNELAEYDNVERRGDTLLVVDESLHLKIMGTGMDFEVGKETAMIRIEALGFDFTMHCSEIGFDAHGIFLDGYNDGEDAVLHFKPGEKGD